MTYQDIQQELNCCESDIQKITRNLRVGHHAAQKLYAALLLLTARKVRLYLLAMKLGYRTGLPELYRMYKSLRSMIPAMIPGADDDRTRLLCGIHTMLCLSWEDQDLFLSQFPPQEAERFQRDCFASNAAPELLEMMFHRAVEEDASAEAVALGLYLTRLSARTSGNEAETHRCRVQHVTQSLVFCDPQATTCIAREQADYFSNAVDEHACMFLWDHGLALYSMGSYDKAAPVLRRCIQLARLNHGDQYWLIPSCQILNDLALVHADPDAEQEVIFGRLTQIVDRYEEGYYIDTNPLSDMYVMLALRFLLESWSNAHALGSHFSLLRRFADYCEINEEAIQNPILTLRQAMVYLSAYYYDEGNYLQSVVCSRKALDAPNPCSVPPLIPDDVILTNLLVSYKAMGDSEAAIQVHNDLVSIYREGEPSENENCWRLLATAELVHLQQLQCGYYEPDMEELRNLLELQYQDLDMFRESLELSQSESASYCLYWITCIEEVLLMEPTRQDLGRCFHIAYAIHQNPALYPTAPHTRIQLLMLLSKIEQRLQGNLTKFFLDKTMEACREQQPGATLHFSVLSDASFLYYSIGQHQLARACAEQAMQIMEQEWHKSVSLLNDQRVSQALTLINLAAQSCYSILRKILPPHEFYEYILRFKDLPSLVCRERNRFMKRVPVDQKLTGRIFELMDRIAAAYQSDRLSGSNTVGVLSDQLMTLEAEFAEKFPDNLKFTPISLEGIAKALPSGAALIEYHFSYDPEYSDPKSVLDIFVTVRKKELAQFHYHTITLQQEDWDHISRYIALLQDEGQAKMRAFEMAKLRTALYELLFGPVESFLEGIDTLYLAPELELFNIPLELLGNRGKGTLQDRFRIRRLICGRDLVFITGNRYTFPGAFVLGNPDYDAAMRKHTYGRHRDTGLEPVDTLPFSGLEAYRVSRRCHTRPTTGSAANKQSLRQTLPKGIIHLATHGKYIEQHENKGLFSSSLIFAGYNCWLKDRFCADNGILTADEISRMDLQKTQLVVLSACCSGMQHAEDTTSRGLVSAFSSTGARWIISHLWRIDDLAPVILMDQFYKLYLEEHMDVPDALWKAKQYLKNITIGQLREDGWFAPELFATLPDESCRILEAYRAAPDRMTPFSSIHDWGGFVCYKCN